MENVYTVAILKIDLNELPRTRKRKLGENPYHRYGCTVELSIQDTVIWYRLICNNKVYESIEVEYR